LKGGFYHNSYGISINDNQLLYSVAITFFLNVGSSKINVLSTGFLRIHL